jgi:hypothetical protein
MKKPKEILERITKNPKSSMIGGLLLALAAQEDGQSLNSVIEMLGSALAAGGSGRIWVLVGLALWLLLQEDKKDEEDSGG